MKRLWPHILFVYFVKLAEVKVVFTHLTNIYFLESFFSRLINSAVRGKVNVKGVYSSNQHSHYLLLNSFKGKKNNFQSLVPKD